MHAVDTRSQNTKLKHVSTATRSFGADWLRWTGAGIVPGNDPREHREGSTRCQLGLDTEGGRGGQRAQLYHVFQGELRPLSKIEPFRSRDGIAKRLPLVTADDTVPHCSSSGCGRLCTVVGEMP